MSTKKKDEQEEKREAYQIEIEEEKEEDPDYSESAKKTRRPNNTHENLEEEDTFNHKTVCLTWQYFISLHICVVMLEHQNTEIFRSCRSAVLQVWERTDVWYFEENM